MNNQIHIKPKPSLKKPTTVTEEIEKLKQRREERKNKNSDNNDKKVDQQQDGLKCDAAYENLIRKKKIAFNQESDPVYTF